MRFSISLFLIFGVVGPILAQDSINVELVGGLEIASYKIAMSDDHIYVIDSQQTMRIISYSEDDQLELQGTYESNYHFNSLALYGNLLYIANLDSGITIIDIEDPTDPIGVASIQNVIAWDVRIYNGLLYVASARQGLRIYDLENQINPEMISQFSLFPNYALGVYINQGIAYVTTLFNGIKILDITNPNDVFQIGHLREPSGAFSMAFSGDYSYIAALDQDFEFSIFDISSPSIPREVARSSLRGGAVSIFISDGLAYIASENSGFSILDFGNFDNILEVGFYDGEGIAEDIKVMDDGNIVVAEHDELNIYRYTPGAGVQPERPFPPAIMSLSAFPNPFNSSTTIRFLTNPSIRSVPKLALYGQDGRMISKLFDGFVQPSYSAGMQTVVWRASLASPGTYFIRLEAGEQVRTEKLILVK